MRAKLTVMFESPFWVGVVEREDDDGALAVARVVFGAEPTGAEVLAWAQRDYGWLAFASASVGCEAEAPTPRRKNPKRVVREVAREAGRPGVSTRAQEAMRLVIEEKKIERRETSKQARDAERERRFALRQAKRKQKHRGR